MASNVEMPVVRKEERFGFEVILKMSRSVEARDFFGLGELKKGNTEDVLKLRGSGCGRLDKRTPGEEQQAKAGATLFHSVPHFADNFAG